MSAVGWWSTIALLLAINVALGLLREWHAKGWREVWLAEKDDAAGVTFGLMFALAIWWIAFGAQMPVVIP